VRAEQSSLGRVQHMPWPPPVSGAPRAVACISAPLAPARTHWRVTLKAHCRDGHGLNPRVAPAARRSFRIAEVAPPLQVRAARQSVRLAAKTDRMARSSIGGHVRPRPVLACAPRGLRAPAITASGDAFRQIRAVGARFAAGRIDEELCPCDRLPRRLNSLGSYRRRPNVSRSSETSEFCLAT
jgi:hypothetical protein